MTCSFLLPSRARYDRLERAVASILGNSKDSEVLVRLDDDDPGAEEFKEAHPEARVFIGPREIKGVIGYLALHHMYTELAKEAIAPWVWMWNDDCTLEVNPSIDWEQRLRRFQTRNVIVHPEWHQWNSSKYRCDPGSAFPCVPNGQWGEGGIQDPMDSWLVELGQKRGWRTKFLVGVTANHQRDREELLEIHRQGSGKA